MVKPSSILLVGTLSISALYMFFLLTNEYLMDSYRVLGVNYNMVAAASIPVMFLSAIVVRNNKSTKASVRKLAVLGTTIPLILVIMFLIGLIGNLIFGSGD